MTGLRRFSNAVDTIMALLVGKRRAIDMKHMSRRRRGIKTRRVGRPRKSVQ